MSHLSLPSLPRFDLRQATRQPFFWWAGALLFLMGIGAAAAVVVFW
jgi:hypothetical protein